MNNYQNIYIFIISPLTGVRATLISEKASCFLGVVYAFAVVLTSANGP